MNIQLEAIQNLIRLNREAARELAKVELTTSADYAHIAKAHETLNEQFHILLQQKEELEMAAMSLGDSQDATPAAQPSVPEKERRGRGATKHFYLKDEASKPTFVAHVKRIFMEHYIPGKHFQLPDGQKVKAHHFLACLYDLGIKLGITSPEPPVKDFCDMISAIAQECPNASDFNTAYNTIQKALKLWNPLTGQPEGELYCTTVRFHGIQLTKVPALHKDQYTGWLSLYTQVEQIYHSVKGESLSSSVTSLA